MTLTAAPPAPRLSLRDSLRREGDFLPFPRPSGASLRQEILLVALLLTGDDELAEAGITRTRFGYIPTPVPGMGVTQFGYSDSHPYEVVAVHNPTTVEVRPMIAEPDEAWKPDCAPGGFVGHTSNDHERKWKFRSDPTAATVRVKLTSRGWRRGALRFRLGVAARFHDSNF